MRGEQVKRVLNVDELLLDGAICGQAQQIFMPLCLVHLLKRPASTSLAGMVIARLPQHAICHEPEESAAVQDTLHQK